MDQSPATKDLSPRRLALVITELEPGGAERCLVELATRLDRSRYAPMVYSLAPPPDKNKQALLTRLIAAAIPVHYLGFTKTWEYFAAVRRLASLLKQQQAQIVQTFLFHANVVGARAARHAGVPHMITGIRVADSRWWRVALERAATSQADRFVCVSQSVAEFCRRNGFASEKLVVIPNGVDLARWRDAKPIDWQAVGVPTGRRVLLYVGRLDKQKGLDRFFDELPIIFRELPEHDLVLAGEGRLRAALSRTARRLRIDRRIHFAGWQADIPALMAAAELLVLPSRWEGMPNIILEAMAAGKPVIATQAEGTVELVGLTALEQTVPVGEWSNLRQRLIEVAKNEALCDDLGRRNQQRAQQFSLEYLADRYQRLYDSICLHHG